MNYAFADFLQNASLPFFGFSSNLTSLGEFVGFGWSLDTMRHKMSIVVFLALAFVGFFAIPGRPRNRRARIAVK